ncbi:hypothetical protein D9M69_703310 [compost metagenome]
MACVPTRRRLWSSAVSGIRLPTRTAVTGRGMRPATMRPTGAWLASSSAMRTTSLTSATAASFVGGTWSNRKSV